MEGGLLYFDMEKARQEEGRSRLARAFASLFRRRRHRTDPHLQDWVEIPLYSAEELPGVTTGDKSDKHGRRMAELKQTCRRFMDGLRRAKPKPIQQTIPLEFQAVDTTFLSPIKSQHETPKPKPETFHKLAADLWCEDEERMLAGTFPFPVGYTQKYETLQVLGEGSFGFVMVARRRKDRREVAVKWALRSKIPPPFWVYDVELGLVPNEVHVLRQISHPSIVNLLDYLDDGGAYVGIVTELHGTEWTWSNPKISGNVGLRPIDQLKLMQPPRSATRRSPCDLFECIEAHTYLPESTVFCIFEQLLQAVLHLWKAGYVHRDLKDENIVVDEEYRIKLVDFGSCSAIPAGPEAVFKQFNGTLAFAAPEIIQGHWYYPAPAEVWSLGILLYTLCYRQAPFHSTEEILKGEPVGLREATEVNDLLRRMLAKNLHDRIPLEEISEHPWMAECRRAYQK